MISLFLSLIAGILASLTPCVAVLFPIVIYRFSEKNEFKLKSYISYVFGFIFAFLIFGVLFKGISHSIISSGFRLFLSVSFVILGILQLMNRINPLHVPLIRNPFLFGGIFAIAIAINPCTLPYLGTIIGIDVSVNIISNLVLFGIGMLLPSSLLLFIGGKIIHKLNKVSSNVEKINKVMALVLILAGGYLGISILNISKLDVLFSSISLALVIGLIIFLSWRRRGNRKGLKENFPWILLIISLILLWVAFTTHCYSIAYKMTELSCSVECPVCKKCTVMFILAALFGIFGIIGAEKVEEKFKRGNN